MLQPTSKNQTHSLLGKGRKKTYSFAKHPSIKTDVAKCELITFTDDEN